MVVNDFNTCEFASYNWREQEISHNSIQKAQFSLIYYIIQVVFVAKIFCKGVRFARMHENTCEREDVVSFILKMHAICKTNCTYQQTLPDKNKLHKPNTVLVYKLEAIMQVVSITVSLSF